MKKKIVILAMGLLFAGAAQAQIFLEEGDANDNRAVSQDWGVVPIHGVTQDQANYVPVGSGIALLAALGGAYLLKKKKINKYIAVH